MVFTAGQKVRALELNRGIPNLVRASADTTVVSSTTLVNATGLVQAVEADALYWWRLLLSYDTGTTPDLKVAWTVPTGSTGFWGVAGATARASAYAATTVFLDGANTLAVLEGYLDTSSTAGSLQLQFAQNTSTASNSIVRTGSVLSLARLP
jgi:hypothetical protein